MRHWLQLAIRNWWVRQDRTFGAVAAIMLGTASVVWVSCSYESVRRTVAGWAEGYVGGSHVTIQSPMGKYSQISQRLLDATRQVDNVAHANGLLIQRLRGVAVPQGELGQRNAQTLVWSETLEELDLHGVEIESELRIRDHTQSLTAGRMLSPDDEWAIVLDEAYAADNRVGLGDALFVWGGAQDRPFQLEIVGLMKRRRVARFQKAMGLLPQVTLQRINSKTGLLTGVDVVLRDPSRIADSSAALRLAVRRIEPSATVRSVEARMRQIEFVQGQQRFLISLLSCIVMLTALVTILSTLSMGLVERIGLLGLMRCIGMTGRQLGVLVLCEVLPLGVIGVAAGVPLGLLMSLVTVWLVPDYVGQFAISWLGVGLGVVAGLATTLVAALLPMIAAMTVSPMEAARPRAGGVRALPLVITMLLGGGLILAQHFVLMPRLQRSATFFEGAGVAIVMLYVGYALIAAPLVYLLSRPVVAGAAALLRLRGRLLQDQVGHAVWRSAGVCCGLMVGLSLIIEILVVNESVTTGWQFPKQFPEAYVWSFDELRGDAGELLATIPGVREVTAAKACNAVIQERRPMFMDQVLQSVTWFMGCDPESFFEMVRVEMVQGDMQDAVAKLKLGGHVVVADDFARSRDKKLGDQITVWVGDRRHQFVIAGVMQSPALDIAASYFQAHSEFVVAASGSVLGSARDMERLFRIDGTRLALINFDLPPEPVPPDWPPPRGSEAALGMPERVWQPGIPLELRWRAYREELVLREARRLLNAPQAFTGTARELKDEIDAQLTEMTRLLTAIPSLALVVAAVGVANLMTANVAARRRQFAILRAVGATRGLVLRTVAGEALVLGLLGSILGLALGMHLATNVVQMIDRMWGFRVELALPWGLILLAIVLTVGLCVLAGWAPARRAAQTNIVEVLRVA